MLYVDEDVDIYKLNLGQLSQPLSIIHAPDMAVRLTQSFVRNISANDWEVTTVDISWPGLWELTLITFVLVGLITIPDNKSNIFPIASVCFTLLIIVLYVWDCIQSPFLCSYAFLS